MTKRQLATISIRILGVVAIIIGGVLVGSGGIVSALGSESLPSLFSSDLNHNYYVLHRVEDPWLAPGAASGAVGILLLVTSRRLGASLVGGASSGTKA